MDLRELFPCFPCSGNVDLSNTEIEKQIKKDRKMMNKIIPILLLGAAECGKSTVLKQMELKYHPSKFEEQREACKYLAPVNLIMATWQLIDARNALGYSYDDLELENRFKDKTEFLAPTRVNVHSPPSQADEMRARDIFPEIADEMNEIWACESIRETITRRAEFYMLDSAEYFKSRIDDIRKPNYNPTVQDVLKARKQTSGIVDVRIQAKLARDKVIFQIIDIGGQQAERKYWSRVMTGAEIVSVLYVFSLSDYNLYVQEKLPAVKINRLLENTQIFYTIINKEEFRNKNIIVFLNKIDIFKEKLKHVPLSVCYPDYPEDNRDPEDALQHIENQIRSQDMTAMTSSTDNLEAKRNINFYRTHATDPQAFQVIVDTVLHSFQADNLRQAGLYF